MPDISPRFTDPIANQKEKEAAARSPLYRCHPNVTVYQYVRMKRPEQDKVNETCRELERAQRAQPGTPTA